MGLPPSIQSEAVEEALECRLVVLDAVADGVVTPEERAAIEATQTALLSTLEKLEFATRRAIHALRTGDFSSPWFRYQEKEKARCVGAQQAVDLTVQ